MLFRLKIKLLSPLFFFKCGGWGVRKREKGHTEFLKTKNCKNLILYHTKNEKMSACLCVCVCLKMFFKGKNRKRVNEKGKSEREREKELKRKKGCFYISKKGLFPLSLSLSFSTSVPPYFPPYISFQ